MRNIILNEAFIKHLINEEKLKNKLSKHVQLCLKKNCTPLGKHISFPPGREDEFNTVLTLRGFKNAIADISKFEELDIQKIEDLSNQLNKLITKCQKIESSSKEKLEKIVLDYVINLFPIPNDTIKFSCELVDSMSTTDANINILPEDDEDVEDSVEFDDIDNLNDVNESIFKRRLINVMIMGFTNMFIRHNNDFLFQIFKIHSSLPELYTKIMVINQYLLYTKNDIKITDKDNKEGGINTINLGKNIDDNIDLNVKAIIAPILLFESVKGFIELFSLSCLPKDTKQAMYIISKSDFIASEPWNMRMGDASVMPILKAIEKDSIEGSIFPTFFSNLVSNKSFIKIMKSLYANTKEGKKQIKDIYNKSVRDVEYEGLKDRLHSKSDSSQLILDEFTPEELEDDFLGIQDKIRNY